MIESTAYQTAHSEVLNCMQLTRTDAARASMPIEPSGHDLPALVRSYLTTARDAQKSWAARPIRSRLKILKKLRLAIAADPLFLAGTIGRENTSESLAAEILPLLDACRFLETQAGRILKDQPVRTRGRPMWLWGNSLLTRREPLGTVLIIGPSNYPLMLPGVQALQAIVAGNAVLVKPAVGCSLCIETLVLMARSVGLPDGLIQVLSESSEAATLAIRQGVDKVFLTGSANTGKAVGHELAERITPSVMELSGCDAVFVLDDADLNLVSECLLFGLTLNSSQTCMAPRRVFASHRQADEIIRLLRAKLAARHASKMQLRNSSAHEDDSCDAPTVPKTNFSNYSTLQSIAVLQHIRAATGAGAELVFGPQMDHGAADLSRPVVLDNVTSDMPIAQSDIFAPVLSFIRVDSETIAVRENERCPYALSASVFGTSARCQQFARQIRAGCVVINDVIVPTADPRVAFGGCGMSGYGKTRGPDGLLEMTQQKVIITSRRWFKPHLHPPTTADVEVLQQLISLEHSPSPVHSLLAVPTMIKATMKQMRLSRNTKTLDS